MERQYTRIDFVRQALDKDLKEIYIAIFNHSNKKEKDTPFDEILKDADEMQHYFRNPMEDYFLQKDRTQKLMKELEIEL